MAAHDRCRCLWWTGSGVLSHYRPLGVPWAPDCSQKRLFRADNECRTSKNNMATRSRVSREACTDPSDVKNRRKSILTTLGLYKVMLRRPCCHADFLMSDTRCRRGKIVSDCNREPPGHLEVCSDSVYPALPTSGTRVGPGYSCARKWTVPDITPSLRMFYQELCSY